MDMLHFAWEFDRKGRLKVSPEANKVSHKIGQL
jgi:hypothetical protein